MKPLNIPKQDNSNGKITPESLTPVTPIFVVTPTGPNKKGAHTPKLNQVSSPVNGFVEPQRPSSIRKPQKRIRSPTLDTDSPGKWLSSFFVFYLL